MARWSSGLRLRPLTPTTGVRIPLGSPLCGADYDEDPPVPIPNTVVKLVRADNTWRAASRKDRSVPQQKKDDLYRPFFVPIFKEEQKMGASLCREHEHCRSSARAHGGSARAQKVRIILN